MYSAHLQVCWLKVAMGKPTQKAQHHYCQRKLFVLSSIKTKHKFGFKKQNQIAQFFKPKDFTL